MLLTGVVFSSLLPQIQGATLREDFQNALAKRNITLIENGRFSIQLFMQALNLCPKDGNQLCELPQELTNIDCDWNLQKTDFSNMKVTNCTVLAQFPLKCLLNGSKFTNSQIEGAFIQNADFSDSEMTNASFDRSTIQNTTMDRIHGDATFREIVAENISSIDLRGFFNFSLARLKNIGFQQNIPENNSGIISLFTTFDFTGANVKEGGFQTIYPESTMGPVIQQPMNMTFSLLASFHPNGTIFDHCNFSVENYHKSCGPDGTGLYAGQVSWIFNLTNAVLPSSIMTNLSNPENCTHEQLKYGGRLENVNFPLNFTFSGWSQKVGSTGWYLYDVAGCGLPHLSECTSQCLMKGQERTVKYNKTKVNEELQLEIQNPNPKYIVDEFLVVLNM